MPEGPSILILKEKLEPYIGKKIISASGYAKVDHAKIKGQKITEIKTWGKHTLICFKHFTIRIHLMMFGSYTFNEVKKYNPKLSLQFKDEFINFYLAQIKIIEEPLNEIYDWSADIMNDKWSAANAKAKLKAKPDMMICDALLDQNIFSGSGNIIKNEALYRAKIHPESIVGKMPAAKITALLKEVRKYAFDFLKWRKANTLSKHWEAYEQEECVTCSSPMIKKLTGKGKRQSYFCKNCQELYR